MTSDLLLSFIWGFFATELFGYIWHRWVAHLGILKFFTPFDFLRKRHVNHHEIDYNPTITSRLIRESYTESCEITFNFLTLTIFLVEVVLVVTHVISIWSLIGFSVGNLTFAMVFLAPFHTYFHLTDKALKQRWFAKSKELWRGFKWLQTYHVAHHYYRCNYAMVIPVDIIFGSYLSPARFVRLKRSKLLKKENLFPNFTNSPSNCESSFFAK